MKCCDICGKRDPSYLVPLRDVYQTKDIKEVCSDCETTLNDKLFKLKSVTHNILVEWFRRYMEERVKK